MILIDPRIGSSDLYPLLHARRVPCTLQSLPFADAALLGRGIEDRPVPIGVERKRLRDLLSSLTSGRLAGHQLPGLLTDYEYVWLVVEGIWRAGANGIIEIPRGHGKWEPLVNGAKRFMARDVEAFLLTLELRGGVKLRRTRDADETADFLAHLYHWWTHKAYDEHKSHLAMNDARDAALLVKPSLVRRVAAQLPGVGYEKSGAVMRAFGTTLNLALGDERAWTQIDGIGKTLAKRIVTAITTNQEHGK